MTTTTTTTTTGKTRKMCNMFQMFERKHIIICLFAQFKYYCVFAKLHNLQYVSLSSTATPVPDPERFIKFCIRIMYQRFSSVPHEFPWKKIDESVNDVVFFAYYCSCSRCGATLSHPYLVFTRCLLFLK